MKNEKKTQKRSSKERKTIESNVCKIVGLWIKTTRRSKHLNQVNLAKEIGTSQSRISKIEAGQLTPDLIDILYLSQALEKSDERFLVEIRQLLEPKIVSKPLTKQASE
jgi:predicted transcriptional regulator